MRENRYEVHDEDGMLLMSFSESEDAIKEASKSDSNLFVVDVYDNEIIYPKDPREDLSEDLSFEVIEGEGEDPIYDKKSEFVSSTSTLLTTMYNTMKEIMLPAHIFFERYKK